MLFSIIIPLYNKEAYILETIETVLNQTYSNFEILIVNDCSTDNSLAVVKQIEDHRIFIFEHTNNKGLSATRNTAISHAKGEIICLLDADDLWKTTYLETIAKLYKSFPEYSFYGTDYIEQYPFGNISPNKTIEVNAQNTSFVIDNFFESNMGQPIICPSSLSFKKSIFEDIQIFDESITFAEDVDFYLTNFAKHKLVYYYQALVKHRDGNPGQMTQNNISHKTIPDFKKYELIYPNNTSVRKYIDFQRYCFAINLKMEQSFEKANHLIKDIYFPNLNSKQQLLLKLPFTALYLIKKMKSFFLKRNIKLSSY